MKKRNLQIWKSLQVLKKTENQYNLLVQIDYLAGLCTAYMLGAEKWSLFVILLGVSLALGILTVKVYFKTLKAIIKR
jgi:hypothetical protein